MPASEVFQIVLTSQTMIRHFTNKLFFFTLLQVCEFKIKSAQNQMMVSINSDYSVRHNKKCVILYCVAIHNYLT